MSGSISVGKDGVGVEGTMRSKHRHAGRPSSDKARITMVSAPSPICQFISVAKMCPLVRAYSLGLVYPRHDANERCGRVYPSTPLPALYKAYPNLHSFTICSNQANAFAVAQSVPFTRSILESV